MTRRDTAMGQASNDLFGHPRGLTILFLTEMWEKFSYYGMRAILVYYMTKTLLFDQQRASMIYGLYTGFIYLTPLFGGYIADRWLGHHRAVIIGGLVMAAGHFAMTRESLFFVALTLIVLGNGLYLPSLPARVASLYAPGDARAGVAMNVYYVGINLGSFLAPILCGTIGEVYGWHYGFAVAGVGMLTGLAIYIGGQRHLNRSAEAAIPLPQPGSERGAQLRRQTGLAAAIILAVVIFRTGYEQLGNTLPLWLDQVVDRRMGDWTIPMTWFLSINPLMVFIATPFLLARWQRRAAAGADTRATYRMMVGALIVGLSFVALAIITQIHLAAGFKTSWVWALLFFVVSTVGELYILPVGLGFFARTARADRPSTAISIWFSAAFAGNLLAGAVGGLWSEVSAAAFFAIIGAICLGASLALRAAMPFEPRTEGGTA